MTEPSREEILAQVELTRLRIEATLDQWLARVHHDRKKGLVDKTPDALYVHLAAQFGIPPESQLPQDVKAQPVLIMLAHAIHRLLPRVKDPDDG